MVAQDTMEEHVHHWIAYLPDAIGDFGTPCRGRVLTCRNQPCGTFLFIPHACPHLAVETVMVSERMEAAA